jgi:hypothetical protein
MCEYIRPKIDPFHLFAQFINHFFAKDFYHEVTGKAKFLPVDGQSYVNLYYNLKILSLVLQF